MQFTLPIKGREVYAPYVFFENEFTPEECDAIIELSKKFPALDARIGSGENLGEVVEQKRRTEVHWIPWSQEENWVFDKLSSVVLRCNDRWYGFDLNGFGEPLQLTHYKSTNLGHYGWHNDFGSAMMSVRKLSVVVLLNDGFIGGDLELFERGQVPLKKGTVVCFPSFEVHRVTPVTEGDRWSLVTWVSGPPYR